MSYSCEFCKKEYTSISSLNYHKKNTKFCLELQIKNNTENNKINTDENISDNNSEKIHTNNKNLQKKEYRCKYCEKVFSQKTPLTNHLTICNVKNYKEKIDNKMNELKEEYERKINDLKINNENLLFDFKVENKLKDEKYLSELKLKEEQIKLKEEQIKLKEEKYISELKLKDEQIKIKDEQLKLKEEIILKLEKKIDENESRLIKNNEKLTNELINRPQHVVNNSNTNNYTLQFNKLKDQMLPFTDLNIKDCIKKINGNTLIYYNDNDVNLNFIGYFVKAVKVLTFCTDSSRGALIIKDEDGNHSKVVASEFVLKCLEKSRKECIEILDKARQFLEDEEKYGNISLTEYAKCNNMLTSIKAHILQGTTNDLTKSISTTLIKNVDKIMKNLLTEN